MFIAIELLAVFFETFLAYYFLDKIFLHRSCKIHLFLIAFITFGLGLALFSLLPVAPIVRMIYTFSSLFILSYRCFSSSLLNAIYISIVFCAIFLFTDLLCYWLLILFGWNPHSILSATAERIIFILVTKITQLFLVMIATLFIRREPFILKLKSIIPLLFCQIFSILICNSMIILSSHNNVEDLSFQVLLIVVGILYLNIIVVIYAEVIKRRQEERFTADLREQELTLQLSYYKSIQLEQERTRSLYHDISKHLAAIETMISSHNKSSAAQVFQDLKDSFQEVGNLVDVGNFELSAILNHYVQLAKDFDIPVSLAIWVPPKLPISPLELNTVIGNSFENAIESCLALPTSQRQISIQMKLHNKHLLLYQISNPYLPGKKIRLRKTNIYHGYGIQNITKIVNKYNGSLRITDDNQLFLLEAYFNLPED